MLLEKSDEDAENGADNTPAYVALQGGHVPCAAHLIGAGASVEQPCEDGATLLHLVRGWASGVERWWKGWEGGGRTGRVPRPLPYAAACTTCSRYCYVNAPVPPQAATVGEAAVVKLLLGRGAPVDALDRWRCTPLMAACRAGQWGVGDLLLGAKASAAAVGRDQWTPLREPGGRVLGGGERWVLGRVHDQETPLRGWGRCRE